MWQDLTRFHGRVCDKGKILGNVESDDPWEILGATPTMTGRQLTDQFMVTLKQHHLEAIDGGSFSEPDDYIDPRSYRVKIETARPARDLYFKIVGAYKEIVAFHAAQGNPLPARERFVYHPPQVERIRAGFSLYHGTNFVLKDCDGKLLDHPTGPAFFSEPTSMRMSHVVAKAGARGKPSGPIGSSCDAAWFAERDRQDREKLPEGYDLHTFTLNSNIRVLQVESMLTGLLWAYDIMLEIQKEDPKILDSTIKASCAWRKLTAAGLVAGLETGEMPTHWSFASDTAVAQLIKELFEFARSSTVGRSLDFPVMRDVLGKPKVMPLKGHNVGRLHGVATNYHHGQAEMILFEPDQVLDPMGVTSITTSSKKKNLQARREV